MQSTIEMKCERNDIVRIVEDVFSTMAGLAVFPCENGGTPPAASLTAAVHFAGAWKGAVLLQCPDLQAFELTSRVLPGSQAMSFTEEVRDVLGEFANMVGGNLKSVLHPGVALSMPSVVEGTNYALYICGTNDVITVSFSSELGPFTVTLVQLPEKQSRSTFVRV